MNHAAIYGTGAKLVCEDGGRGHGDAGPLPRNEREIMRCIHNQRG